MSSHRSHQKSAQREDRQLPEVSGQQGEDPDGKEKDQSICNHQGQQVKIWDEEKGKST